jgi:FdhD protein
MSLINQNIKTIKPIQIDRYKNEQITHCEDFVSVEAPLQIEVNGKPVSITMRTPGDDAALALGFIFTEGLIIDYNAISNIIQKDENTVDIILEEGQQLDLKSLERNFYASSSCGVCGKSSVDAIITKTNYPISNNETVIHHDMLLMLQEKLLSVQSAFEVTGGLHATALFQPDGKYLYHSEDVGRHNALDKLIGHSVMAGKTPLKNHVLFLSGRISFELVQKATMAGVPIILAVGAPSSLAIELAIKNSQTLVGFIKSNSYNIYTGQERILRK